MAKYRAYSEYKDSGIEWLGEIPAGWSMTKMAWNFKAEKGKNGQLLTKDYCGLNQGEYAVYSGQTENDGVMGRINSFEFDTGENGVLFSTTVGAKAMNLSHLTGKFSLSQNCMVIVPQSKNYHIRFSFYHFQPLFAYERGLIPEHMQASFRMEDLYQYQTALPTMEEQEKIANFLDHETAKIDTLIEKQQQLIQLLKEKRQAVISHAVTKGLNPKAKMKDSGVEWLGEVPEGWALPKIKWFFMTESGGTPNTSKFDEYYLDGEIPWIRTTDLSNDVLYETPVKITPKAVQDSACSLVPENSVLIAMYGGAGSIGKHSLLKFESTINQAVCAILPNKKIEPDFLHMYIEFYRPYWMVGAEGTRKDPNINQETIRELVVPCPNTNEQREIVLITEKKLSVIDSIVKKSEANIELMQERRTALISAAVTGKIDVRDWEVKNNKTNKEVVV